MDAIFTAHAVEVENYISGILATNTGNKTFASALERAVTGPDLVRLLARYIHFNSIFSCGVAALAGRVGASQKLFRDPEDQEDSLIGDRSAEIGAQIFFAAIDEFGDRSLKQRGTHRSLAQATLRGAAHFLGIDVGEVTRSNLLNEGTYQAMSEVENGYVLAGEADPHRLLYGIGFHIASETLADEEFRLLDESLQRRFPQLVSYLKGTSVAVNGFQLPGYHWIRVHTTVEVEHSNAAFRAAELALQYYTGPENQQQIKEWILEGVHGFSELQAHFMSSL